MAARRLAISSLLCADEDVPPSLALGSSSPQVSPPRPSTSSHSSSDASLLHAGSDNASGAPPTSSISPPSSKAEELPARDVVPLSLQPVQLRRHTPSPRLEEQAAQRGEIYTEHRRRSSDYFQHSTSTYPPTHPVIHNRDHPGYQHPFQHDTSHHQYSARPHDAYSQPTLSPSATFARPSSSRSSHLNSPALPHSPAAASYSSHSHSPSHSPMLTYSVPMPPRRLSRSPVLSRPANTSPVNFFHTPAQLQSSISGAQSYFGTINPSTLTGPGMPAQPYTPSQAYQPPTHSPVAEPLPAPRRTSAASLPHILNASPPPSRPSGGLAGLEALAQAATQERRRLSGEVAIAEARKSMSPLATRRPLDSPQAESAQHPDAKPPSPTFVRHSPEVRRDILYQVIDSPVASDVARPDSEPPRKRRRSSGEPSFLLQHPATFGPTLSGPGVAGSIPFSVSGPLISKDIVDHAAHLDSGGFDGQVAPTATVPREAVAVHDYDSGGTNEAQEAKKAKGKARDRKRRGSVLKDDGKKKRRESPREDTKTEHSARDEDVTEWLLEQYTTTSLSVEKSMEGTSAVASRSYLDSSRRTDVGGRQSSEDAKSSRAKSKSTHGRTRTPTPLALLEEELELDGKVAVYDAATGEQPDDSDINMELDFAASSATNTKHDDPMDMDVEDELLSLVDDKPRTSQSSQSKSAATARSQDVAQRSKQSQPIWGVSEMYSGLGVPAAFSESQRESMPPPASPVKEHPQTATQSGSRASSVGVFTAQKKKDGAQKTKTKAPPKPKAKTAAKPKTKASKETGSPAPGGTLTPSVSVTSVKSKKASPLVGSTPSGKRAGSAVAGASRSRSTSVLPGGSVGPEVDGKAEEGHAEGEEKDEQDDKLYCVCKTRYDEDRVMIACDRCDEWYHTQCVNMPDLEVDLVDQFICPPCVESNPHLHLKTTYKRRCLNGLEHPNPASPAACHKPARGAFSKYCSDECGMHYMQSRIDAWSGNKELLWESVKDAKKREGVVVRVKSNVDAVPKVEGDGYVPAERPPLDVSLEVVKPSQSKVDREVARLNAQLHGVARYRDELKKEFEVVLWREKVIKLAAIRADNIDECGWDQRLCFGDEEYIEFGASVLESYEETDSGGRPDGDAVTTDGAQPEDGEWWCKGKKKCDRHAGWQKLRIVEVEFDKETKETALAKLTTQERDIRRQIEDVLDPSARARSAAMKSSGPPLQPLNGEATSNGLPKTKVNGDASKKGKKKSR